MENAKGFLLTNAPFPKILFQKLGSVWITSSLDALD
jgi:hypothetical protein